MARKDNTLVIVEVKSRANSKKGLPLEAITPSKSRRLRRLAEFVWRSKPEFERLQPRIDCIGIDFSTTPPEIVHVENAV